MAGTALTYEGIREEMLKEHVLSSYRKDLVVFLAERDFSTLDDISSMAERYESAHARPTTWGSKDRPSNGERKGFTEVAAQQRNEQNGGRPGVDSPSHRHSRGSGNTPGVEKDTQVRRSGPVCYNCNKPGHLGKDCRKPRPYTVSVAVRSNPEGREAQANLLDCRVNGAVAKMLFDSGCNYPVLVNSRFVKPGDYTGKTIVVSTVTGKRSVFRVAYVDLDTPLVKGRVEAGCHGDLVYDVILGTKYAKLRPYPERCNVKPAQDGLESMTSAKQRSGSCRPVTKPLSDSLPEELGRLQKEDASLNRLRGYAKVGSVRKLPDGKVSFVLDRGVLYRIAKKGSNTKKQLVIPVCKREEVLERAHVGPWGNHLCVTKTKSRVGEEFYWPGVYKDARKYCRKCDKCKRRALGTSHRPETCRTSPLRDENRITLAWDLLCRSESPTASSKYSAQPKKEEDSRVVSTQAESRRQDVAKKKSTVESRNVSNKVEGRTSPKSKKKDSTCKKKSKRCSSENDKLQGDEVNEVIPGWLWGRE